MKMRENKRDMIQPYWFQFFICFKDSVSIYGLMV